MVVDHFLCIDYGYGSSAAAAGRFSVDETGACSGTGEWWNARWARGLCKKRSANSGSSRRWRAETAVSVLLHGFGMDQHHDVGKSNFEQMAEVFAGMRNLHLRAQSPADNAKCFYTGLSSFTWC